MTIVVDASVACKWFFEEPLSGVARLLAAQEDTVLTAPDLVLAECANVAWRRAGRNAAPQAQLQAFLKSLPHWFGSLVPSGQLHETAFAMACTLEHPAYDCFYLALADREQTRMVTADGAFVRRVARSPWKHRIEPLGSA